MQVTSKGNSPFCDHEAAQTIPAKRHSTGPKERLQTDGNTSAVRVSLPCVPHGQCSPLPLVFRSEELGAREPRDAPTGAPSTPAAQPRGSAVSLGTARPAQPRGEALPHRTPAGSSRSQSSEKLHIDHRQQEPASWGGARSAGARRPPPGPARFLCTVASFPASLAQRRHDRQHSGHSQQRCRAIPFLSALGPTSIFCRVTPPSLPRPAELGCGSPSLVPPPLGG